MRLRARLGLLVASFAGVVFVVVVTPTPPAHAGCEQDVGFYSAGETCSVDPDVSGGGSLGTGVRNDDAPDIRYEPRCTSRTETCFEPVVCSSNTAPDGLLYQVYVDGDSAGLVCLGESNETDTLLITPGRVLTAFRELSWPASDLTVQPPDGLTLVNFETNFFTRDTGAVTRSVRLLGQPITIEATPVRFRWRFGDGTVRTSSDPGAPYPRLDVTHDYRSTGRFQARLDTIYGGRYRVGQGPWQEIPGTHTVSGDSQALRAVEASPTLVGYDG